MSVEWWERWIKQGKTSADVPFAMVAGIIKTICAFSFEKSPQMDKKCA